MFDEGQVGLYTKYYGQTDLVQDDDFWRSVYDYYCLEVRDAPLPMVYSPTTLRIVRDMLKCPPSVCGGCCGYNHIELNDYDVRRITSNTTYDKDSLGIVIKDGKMTMDGTGGCQFLVGNRCTIYDFRPDACWLFPFSGKSVQLQGEKVKQMYIRIRCEPALNVAREVITEVMSAGDKILLPDLTIIPGEVKWLTKK